MRSLSPEQIEPRVRMANYHDTRHEQAWLQRKIIDLQFIYVVRGCLAYQPAGEAEHLAEQDSVLCIQPTVHHDLRMRSDDGIISGIHCELGPGTWASGDYRLKPQPALVTRPDPAQQLLHLFKLCAEAFLAYGTYQQARCDSLCKCIILGLAEHWQERRDAQFSQRMQDMITFIREHLAEDIGRQQLAAAFYLTPEHINYIFKQETGMTPTEVINRERCIRAHQLLTNGMSVKEAAYAVGFKDPQFFSRIFKKYFQVPPSLV